MHEKAFSVWYFSPSQSQKNIFKMSFPQVASKWVSIQILFKRHHWVRCLTKILATCVVVDVSKYLGILIGIENNLGASSILTWVKADAALGACPAHPGSSAMTVLLVFGLSRQASIERTQGRPAPFWQLPARFLPGPLASRSTFFSAHDHGRPRSNWAVRRFFTLPLRRPDCTLSRHHTRGYDWLVTEPVATPEPGCPGPPH